MLARDHPQLDSAGAKLRDTLQAMDTTAPDARAQGHAFYLALAGFTGEYLLHLADEELKVNPALWARFTDAELQSVERKLVADIPPELTPKVLTAMLPSLTRQGLAGLMGGMRAGMPPQVFDNIWKLAQNVLPESSFKQLSADLNV